MQAVVLQNDRTVKVERRPVPVCQPNQLLIRNMAFGQNPSDWKHAAFLSQPGAIMGCDSIGVVEEIGSEVPAGFTDKGDRRGVFMRGGMTETNGAFAEYTAIDYDFTFRIPANLANEDAATLPACFFTAPHILYLRMGLPEPSSSSASNAPWLLVWSGATSVGQFVIQLAKLSGCRIVTTASRNKWSRLKELGADECLDYKDPNIVEHLKAATSDSITFAIDCFGEQCSVEQVYEAVSSTLPSHVISVLPLTSQLTHKPNVVFDTTVLYTALGSDVHLGPFVYKPGPNDQEHHKRWLREGPKLFEDGKVKPLEWHKMGGLQQVQEGFELMREGKVSGEKLIYTYDGE